MIILIDQKEYAVGLNWFAVSTPGEVEQFQREMELNHGVLKMSKESSVQSTVALCGPEYDGQVSLAGMLAYSFENLLVVMATEYKDPNGLPLFYLCAIKNHAVTVDGDVIGTREVIQPLYTQNYADITADIDPSNVTCYGVGVDDTLFPGINIVETHQVLDQALRYASQATIKQLGKKAVSKSTVIVLLCAFIGVAFLFYEFFLKPPPPPPPPPPHKAAPHPVAPAPVVIPKRNPYDDFLKQFEETLAKQPRPSVIPPVVVAVKNLPLSFNGWTVTTIKFSGETADSLVLTLVRGPLATVDGLMTLNDKGYFTQVNIDLLGSNAIVNVPFNNAALSYIPTTIVSEFSSTGSPNYYELISGLQLNNFPYTAKEIAKNNYFSQMGVTLTGTGLWSLMAVYDIFAPFESLAITSITITMTNGDYNWTIEGVIYG